MLKAKVDLYENNRKAALELHFQLFFAAKSSIPKLQLNVSADGLSFQNAIVQPDPFFGFRQLESKGSEFGALGDLVNGASGIGGNSDGLSIRYRPIIFRDLKSGQIRVSSDHLWLRGYYARISEAGPTLARYTENRQRLLLLDRNFSIFLVNFEKTYRNGIENDAELRQAINVWRLKLAEFNAQLSYSNKLNSKLQSIENKTLKLLGNKVLKFIAFSPKKELEKLAAN